MTLLDILSDIQSVVYREFVRADNIKERLASGASIDAAYELGKMRLNLDQASDKLRACISLLEPDDGKEVEE